MNYEQTKVTVKVSSIKVTNSKYLNDILESGDVDSYAECWVNDYKLDVFKPEYGSYLEADRTCASRLIWEGEDFLIKLDDDYDQVQKETHLWNDVISKEDKQYFTPILKSGLSKGRYRLPWLLTPKLELYSPKGFVETEFDELIGDLAYKYQLDDVEMDCGVNWAINVDTGQPIIYDYGL